MNKHLLSMKENLIEEAYECVDSIIENDRLHACEELGDLYLLVTFITYMYQQENSFTFEDVFNSINSKLVRRHPHIFSDSIAGNSREVVHQWEEIKDKVEGRIHDESVLDSVPAHFPPLMKSLKIQKKVARQGFDWDNIDDVIGKLEEETIEFREAAASGNRLKIEEEIGDILFSIVNISRHLSVDPSTALANTNRKFSDRYRFIEKKLKDMGFTVKDKNLDELEDLWQQAKSELKEDLSES